jgi:hypothetical protein
MPIEVAHLIFDYIPDDEVFKPQYRVLRVVNPGERPVVFNPEEITGSSECFLHRDQIGLTYILPEEIATPSIDQILGTGRPWNQLHGVRVGSGDALKKWSRTCAPEKMTAQASI